MLLTKQKGKRALNPGCDFARFLEDWAFLLQWSSYQKIKDIKCKGASVTVCLPIWLRVQFIGELRKLAWFGQEAYFCYWLLTASLLVSSIFLYKLSRMLVSVSFEGTHVYPFLLCLVIVISRESEKTRPMNANPTIFLPLDFNTSNQIGVFEYKTFWVCIIALQSGIQRTAILIMGIIIFATFESVS